MPKAIAQITIRDENDITVGTTPPSNPVADQMWLDTSINPSVLKEFSGSRWEIVNNPETKDVIKFTGLVGCTVTGATVTGGVATNWGAGFFASNALYDGDYVEYRITDNTRNMFGLSNSNPNHGFSNILFALYKNLDGVLLIYETGVSKTTTTEKWKVGDILGIGIDGNKVKYYMNGKVLYTSLVTPTLPLYIDGSIHAINSVIADIKIGKAPTSIMNTVNALQTDFTVANGQIGTLIKDTTITTIDGKQVKLKDAYSSTSQTVEGLVTKVSDVETDLNAVDGIKARVKSVETKVTSTSIVNTINESINAGTTSINTVTTTLDKNGFTIKNGAIKILNKANVEVLLSDVNGDITMRGKFEQYNLSNGVKGIDIVNNQINLYDSLSNGDFVGSLYTGRVPGETWGSLALYGDTGNPLSLGCGDKVGIIINDNYSKHTPLYFAQKASTNSDINMLGYSDIVMYGQDYGIPLLILAIGGDNNAYLLSNKANNKTTRLGGSDVNGGIHTYFQADAGGCQAYGNLACTGTKMRMVNTEFGVVGQNAYETASPMFGDIGEGTIGADGLCYIFIDPIMLATINTKCSYQVFLQKYGEGDVYPVERNENYFVVKGTKGLKFAWELKAHQKGFENDRLEILDNLVQTDYTSGMEVLEDEINYEENANEYLIEYEKELFIDV